MDLCETADSLIRQVWDSVMAFAHCGGLGKPIRSLDTNQSVGRGVLEVEKMPISATSSRFTHSGSRESQSGRRRLA